MTDLVGENKRYTEDEVALLRRTLLSDGTDDDVKLFVAQCERTGLDPFTRQIYATFMWDKKLQRKKMSIQATIDGFRVVAGRTSDYAGQSGPFWCDSDGEWKDVWLSSDPPAAARVGVSRKGFVEPLYAVALWGEYKQTKPDGNLAYMWKKMSAHMLAKCAEALALRKAFPNDLSGVYSSEEMEQATEGDNPEHDEEPPKAKPQSTPPKDTRSKADIAKQAETIAKLQGEVEALGDNGVAAVLEICSGKPYHGLEPCSMTREMALGLHRDLMTLKDQLTAKEKK